MHAKGQRFYQERLFLAAIEKCRDEDVDKFPGKLSIDGCDACKTIVIFDCIQNFSS